MPSTPPPGVSRVCPFMFYENAGSASTFLQRAFGFEERSRHTEDDGRVAHVDLDFRGQTLMLGCTGRAPEGRPPIQSPRQAGAITNCVYIYVDDVDAHCERAREAGAKIVDEPADQFWGDRMYTCEDPEGHFWSFATHVGRA